MRFIIAVFLASLLTGCASYINRPAQPGGDYWQINQPAQPQPTEQATQTDKGNEHGKRG